MSKWQKKQISEIAKLSAGGTPSTDKKEYWENGTVPWMASGEVHRKKIYYTEKSITELGLKNSSAKLFPKKTILIALAGQGKTRGTVAISESELTTNQSIAGVILKVPNILPEFIFYNLDNRYDELRNISTGGGREGLNLQIIGDIEIEIPPLNEQKKIAEVLMSMDRVIELTLKEINKLKDLKKGMLQELLLKGIGHRKFKDTIIGKIPESWELCEIGEVLQERLEPIVMKDSTEYSLVKAKRDFKGIVFREKNFGKNVLVKKQFIIRENDFIISKRQIVHGGCGLVPKDLEGSIVSNEYNIFIGTNKLNIEYFSYLSQSQLLINYFFDCSQGVIIEKLLFKTNQWLKCLIALPSVVEQKKITISLRSVEEKILAEEIKLAKYSDLKKGLMNDLLTGKIRVKV